MSPNEIERGLRALLHLVHRAAPWELDPIASLSAQLRALLSTPPAQRDERAVPTYLRRFDADCMRLFGVRFEDLATLDLDSEPPVLAIVCGRMEQWAADARGVAEDPDTMLALGRHLTLLGAPETAQPLFRSMERLDPSRAGIARGWYLLATLLCGQADEAARVIRQTREAGDFQYLDGDHYLCIYEAWSDALNGVLRAFHAPSETLLEQRPRLNGPSFVYFELALATAATGRLALARRALSLVRPTDFDPLYPIAVAASPALAPLWSDDESRDVIREWYATAQLVHALPDAATVRREVTGATARAITSAIKR